MKEDLPSLWGNKELPYPFKAIERGDLLAALNEFALREMLDYIRHGRFHADAWICGFGMTLWLMGDTDGAGRVWSKATDEALKGKFKYSSTGTFQAGLLLWFASIWLNNENWHEEAAALFSKLLNRRRPMMSGHLDILIARLLRKETELADVQSSYQSRPEHVRQSSDLKVLFYAGVRAYEEGDVDKTKSIWTLAQEPTSISGSPEYYLMRAELKKLN